MARGDRYFEQGRYSFAELQYKSVLRSDPKSGEAYYKLGLTERRLERPLAAYEALNRAASLLPAGHPAHVALADVCVSMYMANPQRPKAWAERVVSIADALLSANPGSYDGLRLKGYLAMMDDDPAKAAELLEKADRANPDQPDLVTVLVQNLIVTGRAAQAEARAQALIAKKSDFSPIYDTLYFHLLGTGRASEAGNVLEAKIRNNPREGLFVIQLCRHFRRTGRKGDLDRTLSAFTANTKSYPDAHLLAGDFLAESGQPGQALEQYGRGERLFPKLKAIYQKRQVQVLAGQNRPGEALAILDRILEHHPKDGEARAARASLWAAAGTPDKLDRAIAEFQDLVRANPGSVEFSESLSRAYRMKGAEEEARELLSGILDVRPDYVPALEGLADINIRGGRYAEALGFSERAIRVNPGSARARLILATSQAGLSHFAESRKTLAALIRDYPNLAEAQLQLGLLNVAEKRYGEAEAIFRRHYRPGAGDIRIVRHLVEMHSARKQWPLALRTVQEELARNPASRPLRELLASTAARSGDRRLAIELYGRLAGEDPKNGALALELGSLYIDGRDAANAVLHLERAAAILPGDAEVAARLGSAYQLAERPGDARRQYRHSLDLRPHDAVVMNNLAFLLAEAGEDLDQALRLAQAAVEAMPQVLTVRNTLGLVYLKRGMTDAAQRIFSDLALRESGNPLFRYHHALALLQSGARSKARQELVAALNANPAPEHRVRIRRVLEREF